MSKSSFCNIAKAIEDIRQGKMVVLVDDEKRENEGDLVMAAEHVSAERINFMAQYGRGLICMPMQAEAFKRLRIPMMSVDNQSRFETGFGVSIGAATGMTTGISAADRALTIQVAADPHSVAEDIVMPGHIFPLKARDGGVLQRAGHTEGSVDLACLAGCQPAAVICEIMNPDGTMARMPELNAFAKEHQLSMISIAALQQYRMQHECLMEEVSSANLPVREHGEFTIKTFRHKITGVDTVVLTKGLELHDQPVLVRLHSECLTGDVFASKRCDCGTQLDLSLQQIAQQGGVLLYLNQEGRGIGLSNKIKAYALQDQGLDTVEANHELGFSADERDYGVAAQLLKALGIQQVQLLTNNPRKLQGLRDYGVDVVARVPLESVPTADNVSYLRTKRDKLGHLLNKVEV